MADNVPATLRLVAEAEPVAPQLLNGSVPRDLEVISLKCLQKDSRKRYLTARDLSEELERFLKGEPIKARPVSRTEKGWRWCQRNPALASAGVGLVMALAAVAIISTSAAIRIGTAKDGEKRHRQIAEQRELEARQSLYDVDMNLARLALDANDRERAAWLLERNIPKPGKPDLRNWEWRYLWGVTRGDELFTFGFHSNAVSAIAVSSDMKLVVSGDYSARLHIWDMERRHLVEQRVFASGIYSVAFSPGAESFAVSGYRFVKVLDRVTREELFSAAAASNVRSVVYAPDGRYLAWLTTSGVLEFADLDKKAIVARFQVGTLNGTLRGALAIAPESRMAAVGELDGRIRLIEGPLNSPKVSFIHAHGDSISALAFSRNGKVLVSGAWDGKVRAFDTSDGGKLLYQMTNHSAWISGIAIAPADDTVATSSADQTIRLWSLSDGTPKAVLKGHLGEVWAVAYCTNGMLVSGGKDNVVKAWIPASSSTTNPSTVPPEVKTIEVSTDGRTAALIKESEILVCDPQSFRQRARIYSDSVFRAGAYSPDGKMFAAGTGDGTIYLWDSANWREKLILTNQLNSIVDLVFSEDGKALLSFSADRDVVRYSTANGKIDNLAHLPAKAGSRLYAGRSLWAAVSETEIVLGSLREGVQLASPPKQPMVVRGVAFSPDETLIAIAGEDGIARVWSVTGEREIVRLRGHRNAVYSVAFSAEGSRLITGGGEGSIKLWDIGTWEEVGTFEAGRNVEHLQLCAAAGLLLARSSKGWTSWKAPSLKDIDGWSTLQPALRQLGFHSEPGQVGPSPIIITAVPPWSASAPIRRTNTVPVALNSFFNGELHVNWQKFAQDGPRLSLLQPGRAFFGEIEFEIGGVIQLNGTNLRRPGRPEFPGEVTGIRMWGSPLRLHLLLGTTWVVPDGTSIGALRFNYQNGEQVEMPIVYGAHVRDWLFVSDPKTRVSSAKVVWTEPDHIYNSKHRIYSAPFENPRPSARLQTVDLVSKNTRSSPFVLAITVEE